MADGRVKQWNRNHPNRVIGMWLARCILAWYLTVIETRYLSAAARCGILHLRCMAIGLTATADWPLGG